MADKHRTRRTTARRLFMKIGEDYVPVGEPEPETPVEDIDYIGQGFINAYWADLDASPYWVTGYFPTV